MSKNQKLKDSFFTSVKLEVIAHLKGVSNQKVTIPIQNHKEITVMDMINEVENGTETGVVYMEEHIKTLFEILKNKKKN